ncbi:unnamed protein product [Moneuplotes crassus]|uniref:Uncharacterized protein n=1 Tax=Euplotes crassus TaxID=5936 RepID=A0AAD1XS82_EUPCR|nr:unnamed protein product [Moneuplotes crassus]
MTNNLLAVNGKEICGYASHHAPGSHWEISTEGGSMIGDHSHLEQNGEDTHLDSLHPQQSECHEENHDSITIINDIINPIETVKSYLIKKSYISKETEENKQLASQKLIKLLEELGQNFYYAFIAQAALNIVKGAISPKNKFIPSILKIFGRKNLSLCALLAVLGCGYKFAMERLRKLSAHHDKLNTFVSILLATWSLTRSKSSSSRNYTYFLVICKYLEMMSKILEKGKVIKKVKNFDVEFYELCMMHFKLRFSLRVKISRT